MLSKLEKQNQSKSDCNAVIGVITGDKYRNYERKVLLMDKILVAIIVFLAAAYLFRRFYRNFKHKDLGCECGSCASNCGQRAISCESYDADNKEMKEFD